MDFPLGIAGAGDAVAGIIVSGQGGRNAVGILDDVFWRAMSVEQAHFATGTGAARRYAPGFSPILGFEDREHPDFAALEPYCQPGERFYVDTWSGPPPPGWQVAIEKRMKRMLWTGALPDEDETLDARPLEAAHAQQALELALLTNPGPFGPRTIELGDYFGVFEDGHLVAMAGERLHAGQYREVSGVCTHPGHQGRGLARRLSLKVVRLQMQRGLSPFLHVISSNTTAHSLYERMGFEDYKETVVRVIERTG
jgi:ribosomal protein S18 acetylase RimI-like enzyme